MPDPVRKLSVVVPVYGSAVILPTLVERFVVAMRAQGLLEHCELVLVNDASPDGSWSVIRVAW